MDEDKTVTLSMNQQTTIDMWGACIQAASACFFLSGMWGDILIVRVFLFLAYIWLLATSITGAQAWPNYTFNGNISVDGLVWAILNLYMHGSNILRLLWDERPIKFKTEDEEQLYRFFNRRGGMERMEMQIVLRKGSWRRIKAGEVILTPVQACTTLVLLVEGMAYYVLCTSKGKTKTATLFSGMTFDIALMNVFGVYIGFDKKAEFEVVAETDCLAFEWDIRSLNELAVRSGHSTSSYFRNFVLSQCALEWEYRTHSSTFNSPPRCSRGYPENEAILSGARSCDFTDELDVHEMRPQSIKTFFVWLWNSLSPHIPPGLRHSALPVSGVAARRRLLALKTAERKEHEEKLKEDSNKALKVTQTESQ